MGPARTNPASTSSSASRSCSSALRFGGPLVVSAVLHAALLAAVVALTRSQVETTLGVAGRTSAAVAILAPEEPEPEFARSDELLEPIEHFATSDFDEPLPEFGDLEAEIEAELAAARTVDPFAWTRNDVDEVQRERVDPDRTRSAFERLPVESLGGPVVRHSVEAPLVPAEEPPVPVDEQDDRPELLEAPPPRYPLLAVRRGYEGSVLVQIDLRTDGSVAHVAALESSGHAVLDEAALAAVRGWRFVPGPPGRSTQHRVTFALHAQR